jgi:hypothetical protein
MSFKLFIYYCAICGGWAAFFTWAVAAPLGLTTPSEWPVLQTAALAAILGTMLGFAIGTVDALLSAVGFQRLVRAAVSTVVGLAGSFLLGLVAEAIRQGAIKLTGIQDAKMPRFPGWILVGIVIGLSVGVFDLALAIITKRSLAPALKKVRNGVLGGLVGGLVGGLLFDLFLIGQALIGSTLLGQSILATALVILGLCIGLLIGLAQIILKEAWVRVEQGFRPGRELMLVKDETTIGRAESCDLGLFGDNGVERRHARILLNGGRYMLYDEGTPGGTFLNDRRIDGPTPLRSGDVIRLGRNVLVFGERQKRPA